MKGYEIEHITHENGERVVKMPPAIDTGLLFMNEKGRLGVYEYNNTEKHSSYVGSISLQELDEVKEFLFGNQ